VGLASVAGAPVAAELADEPAACDTPSVANAVAVDAEGAFGNTGDVSATAAGGGPASAGAVEAPAAAEDCPICVEGAAPSLPVEVAGEPPLGAAPA
jgi:hypothetical protein